MSRDLYSLSIKKISFSFVRSPLFFTQKKQIIDILNLLRSFLYRVSSYSQGCVLELMRYDSYLNEWSQISRIIILDLFDAL